MGGFYINGNTFFSPKSLVTFGFCFLFSHISKHLWTKEVVISFFSANFTLIFERWLCPLEYPFKHGSSQHGRFVRVEWLMHTAKRGWELFQSWVTRFGWEFCSTLMHTAKRGWELYESWVTRFGGEFCSTLMHTAKRGWELYESWVTRFGWEFCLTLMYAVKRGWELSDLSWMRVLFNRPWAWWRFADQFHHHASLPCTIRTLLSPSMLVFFSISILWEMLAFWMRGLVVKLISKTSSCIRPILMHVVKRGWELYESWVTRFGRVFFNSHVRGQTRMRVVWELSDLSCVRALFNSHARGQTRMRVEWEFCSTLVRVVKQGWELYESRVTRFRRRVLFNFNARGHTRISVHEIHAILFIRTSNCPYFLILPKSGIVARNNKKALRNACLLLFHSALCDKISIQRPRSWRACWSLFQ